MGVISLPVMLKYGYSVRHTTGVIAASGTITQLVPPSLVLVVLADVPASRSATCTRRDRPSFIQIGLPCITCFRHIVFPLGSAGPAAGERAR